MRLVTAVLARNEAAPDRYLRRVVERCQEFSGKVLLLDDRSTDATPSMARELGCDVRVRGSFYEPAWGKEATARAQLWEWAVHEASGSNGWVLICDADMLLQGDPRPLCFSWEAAAWAWPLADLWNDEQHFRVDGPWGLGPSNPRPWLFRTGLAPQGWKPTWSKRGIHCGHFPENLGELGPCLIAPPNIFWLHLGWVKREHRIAKAEQYAKVSEQMSEFERQHCATILD